MDVPQSGYLLLDGAMATNLHSYGMPYGICIEEFILNHPEVIQQLQSDFISAGSDILYAPTFSANRAVLETFRLDDEVNEINNRLVALTKSVASGKKVAGNLSPTGLLLEPFGETTFEELVSIYEEQARALDEAGVDLFAIETMLSLGEARAAVLACRKFNKPIYVCMTINEKGKTLSGATPLNCLITLQELGIAAFGLNCSCGPELLEEHIKELALFSKVPLIAKPNAGNPNPILQNQYDLSPDMMKVQMEKLLDAGATIVGGCCGTTPEHIAKLRELLNSYVPPNKKEHEDPDNDIFLASETQFFALDNDRTEFTEPIYCQFDMTNVFVSVEADSFDVILIHIDTVDDAMQFAKNAHLANLPICIYATDEQALELSLRYYHGRLLVDAQSPLEPSTLQQLAFEYGSMLY